MASREHENLHTEKDARRPEGFLRTLWRVRVQLLFLLLVSAIGIGSLAIDSQAPAVRNPLLKLLGADPLTYRYSDLRTILVAVQASRSGVDIMKTCRPCAVAEDSSVDVPFNYPATVLWLTRFIPASWTPGAADWIGPWIALAFMIAAATVLLSHYPLQAAFSLALLISPPVMLGVNRANTDLIFFCLTLLNLWLIDRWSNGAAYVGAFALGVVKLYPVVTILGLLRKTRSSLLWFLATIAAELTFVAVSFQNLRSVARNTPTATYLSYGYRVFFLYVTGHLHRPAAVQFVLHLALPCLVLFFVLIVFLSWRFRSFIQALLLGGLPSERTLYLAGAAIFSASFALGTNFEYRLIFLLFTVPQLFTILRRGQRAQARVALLVLVTMMAALWMAKAYTNHVVRPMECVCTWALFGFFASACLAQLYWAAAYIRLPTSSTHALTRSIS